jgi:hypothetical protein
MFPIDSNVQGTGKGKLVESIARIVTGRPMAVMSFTTNEEELEKRITALALGGESLVLIDNVVHELRSPSLDAVLTAPGDWQGRRLGRTEMVRVPAGMTWYVTGNNLLVSRDLVDRAVHIRLESNLECPRDRPASDFRHPQLGRWVMSERPRLLGAALTLLRGYFAAGRPDQGLCSWGSFEEWSALVRGAIVWAGLPDPAATRRRFRYDADRESDAAGQLLVALDALNRPRGITAAEVLRISETTETPGARSLAAAVVAVRAGAAGGLPTAHELGLAFLGMRHRVIDGRRLVRTHRSNEGAIWVVEPVMRPVAVIDGDAGDDRDAP